VEFLLDLGAARGNALPSEVPFFFMEMNTRLQVGTAANGWRQVPHAWVGPRGGAGHVQPLAGLCSSGMMLQLAVGAVGGRRRTRPAGLHGWLRAPSPTSGQPSPPTAAARRGVHQGLGFTKLTLNKPNNVRIHLQTSCKVEHPVTEAIHGLDLVALQLAVAAGRRLPLTQEQVRAQPQARLARAWLASVSGTHHSHSCCRLCRAVDSQKKGTQQCVAGVLVRMTLPLDRSVDGTR